VSFTAERRQIFLDHLAACCNVKRAAEAAGVGISTVYDARRRDPVFAQQWDEAMEVGYATLEALLIERAATGGHYVPGDTPVPGPETIDTWLALDLLRLRGAAKAARRPVGRPPGRASEKETTEAILAGLEVHARRRTLRRRKGADGKSEKSARRGPPSPRTPSGGEGAELRDR
jgi:hypothetical protein